MISEFKKPERLTILPGTYEEIPHNPFQRRYIKKTNGLSVIHGLENHDGKWWVHLSAALCEPLYSSTPRIPTWEELKEIKEIFIGRDKKAIQLLPSEKEYVNHNPFCLHLFYSEDDGLPDFTGGRGCL